MIPREFLQMIVNSSSPFVFVTVAEVADTQLTRTFHSMQPTPLLGRCLWRIKSEMNGRDIHLLCAAQLPAVHS